MPDQCDYCWRPKTATIYLNNGVMRNLLRLPRRKRHVCSRHLLS